MVAGTLLSTMYFRLGEVCSEAQCIIYSAASALKHVIFC